MADRTPLYLKLAYQEWFDKHPEARMEIATTTVRQQRLPGRPAAYVKNTPSGEVQITKEEFDARYWAREYAPVV
jgi:hypothetical protein